MIFSNICFCDATFFDLLNTSLKIDVLDPKALKLLQEIADMNLIRIKRDSDTTFPQVLEILRKQMDSAPSMEEFTQEVEIVRQQRYESQQSKNNC